MRTIIIAAALMLLLLAPGALAARVERCDVQRLCPEGPIVDPDGPLPRPDNIPGTEDLPAVDDFEVPELPALPGLPERPAPEAPELPDTQDVVQEMCRRVPQGPGCQ